MDGSIHQLLSAYGVSVVSHVPDAGHTALIRRCQDDEAMHCVTLDDGGGGHRALRRRLARRHP